MISEIQSIVISELKIVIMQKKNSYSHEWIGKKKISQDKKVDAFRER